MPWTRREGVLSAALLRLVCPRLGAEGDRQAVPAVDRHGDHRQLDQLLLAELALRALVYVVGNVAVRDLRQRFRPLERRPLAVRVVGGLAPGIQAIQPLLGLTFRPGVL